MAKAKGVAERIEDAVTGMFKSATKPGAKKSKSKAKASKKKAAKKAKKTKRK